MWRRGVPADAGGTQPNPRILHPQCPHPAPHSRHHIRHFYTPHPLCRWEVFICTTAEREYALEVWRLLDPDGLILRPEELPLRLVNVPHTQPKQLQAVLGRSFAGLGSGEGAARGFGWGVGGGGHGAAGGYVALGVRGGSGMHRQEEGSRLCTLHQCPVVCCLQVGALAALLNLLLQSSLVVLSLFVLWHLRLQSM
jgi:hypothetical protein